MMNELNEEIEIVTIRPEFAPALAELQRACFPSLGEQELMNEDHFLTHCEIFPEGEFVALVNGRVVALGSGFFYNFNFEDPRHTFNEIIAGGYYTNHDPEGEYYYGADISVHPEFRGRRIGRKLYEARKNLVRETNRKGIVAGGVLPGYPRHRDQLTIHEYVEQVIEGELFDPTLSMQLRNGFEVKGLLKNYIEDSNSDNWATLIFWQNPDYVAKTRKKLKLQGETR
ncbi:MAG: GNAT family N-acetyltransferase [Anaerolineales bacterium]|nr:GNAT family N-acetyltransferase [Anaerolineales bacterium]